MNKNEKVKEKGDKKNICLIYMYFYIIYIYSAINILVTASPIKFFHYC